MKLSPETLRSLVSVYVHLLDTDFPKTEAFLTDSINPMLDEVLTFKEWRKEVDQWKDKTVLYEVHMTNMGFSVDKIFATEEAAKTYGHETTFDYVITARIQGMDWKCRATIGHGSFFNGYSKI